MGDLGNHGNLVPGVTLPIPHHMNIIPWCHHITWAPLMGDDTPLLFITAPSIEMEQIKRANKLFSTDCIFLRKSLNIPVISEKTSLFNGLNLLDSPENESQEDSNIQGEDTISASANIVSPASSPETNRPIVTQDEELSAKDFLHRLDLQIKRSTQAAKRLKEEEYLRHEEEEYHSTSYQH
uniref:LysM domain-containing protein n=1 Tax=Pyxicephalus adspersus TaxID=30357 RepID=A0AAV3B117_PYXAD|nr:TPA: hypothetical protein GDO54_007538 [Pyxicephalus adspersus]